MPSLPMNDDVASLSIFELDSLITQVHFLHLQNSVLPSSAVIESRRNVDASIALIFHY